MTSPQPGAVTSRRLREDAGQARPAIAARLCPEPSLG